MNLEKGEGSMFDTGKKLCGRVALGVALPDSRGNPGVGIVLQK